MPEKPIERLSLEEAYRLSDELMRSLKQRALYGNFAEQVARMAAHRGLTVAQALACSAVALMEIMARGEKVITNPHFIVGMEVAKRLIDEVARSCGNEKSAFERRLERGLAQKTDRAKFEGTILGIVAGLLVEIVYALDKYGSPVGDA